MSIWRSVKKALRGDDQVARLFVLDPVDVHAEYERVLLELMATAKGTGPLRIKRGDVARYVRARVFVRQLDQSYQERESLYRLKQRELAELQAHLGEEAAFVIEETQLRFEMNVAALLLALLAATSLSRLLMAFVALSSDWLYLLLAVLIMGGIFRIAQKTLVAAFRTALMDLTPSRVQRARESETIGYRTVVGRTPWWQLTPGRTLVLFVVPVVGISVTSVMAAQAMGYVRVAGPYYALAFVTTIAMMILAGRLYYYVEQRARMSRALTTTYPGREHELALAHREAVGQLKRLSDEVKRLEKQLNRIDECLRSSSRLRDALDLQIHGGRGMVTIPSPEDFTQWKKWRRARALRAEVDFGPVRSRCDEPVSIDPEGFAQPDVQTESGHLPPTELPADRLWGVDDDRDAWS
jgi:hypothetical protein